MLIAVPESMIAAAADLATIGSAVDVAHMAAAAPTVAVVPAAADEVSSTLAQLFSRHARDYQALAARGDLSRATGAAFEFQCGCLYGR